MPKTNRYQTFHMRTQDALQFHKGMRVWLSRAPLWRRTLNRLLVWLRLKKPYTVLRVDAERGSVTVGWEE